MKTGPPAGLRVVELAGIGPDPHACMLLADLGADVFRIERAGAEPQLVDHTLRNRRIVGLDLKDPGDVERVLGLLETADVLVEGFRPGVTERMGLGPDDCLARNPCLVYGRMTGWGQEGRYASTAGHDINYISIAGILEDIGRPDQRPVPPLNLVGDFGGGSMFLATRAVIVKAFAIAFGTAAYAHHHARGDQRQFPHQRLDQSRRHGSLPGAESVLRFRRGSAQRLILCGDLDVASRTSDMPFLVSAERHSRRPG